MAVEVVEDQDGVFSEMACCFVVGFAEDAHAHGSFWPWQEEACPPATVLHVAFFPLGLGRKHGDFWLKVVGEAQEEVESLASAQSHGEGKGFVQLGICVVWTAFVDDVRDETEGEGAVYAIAFAMPETGQPNERI